MNCFTIEQTQTYKRPATEVGLVRQYTNRVKYCNKQSDEQSKAKDKQNEENEENATSAFPFWKLQCGRLHYYATRLFASNFDFYVLLFFLLILHGRLSAAFPLQFIATSCHSVFVTPLSDLFEIPMFCI